MADDQWHTVTLAWDGRLRKLEHALDVAFSGLKWGSKVVLECGGRTSDAAFIRSVCYHARGRGFADIRLEGIVIRKEDQPVLDQMKEYLAEGSATRAAQGAAATPMNGPPKTGSLIFLLVLVFTIAVLLTSFVGFGGPCFGEDGPACGYLNDVLVVTQGLQFAALVTGIILVGTRRPKWWRVVYVSLLVVIFVGPFVAEAIYQSL